MMAPDPMAGLTDGPSDPDASSTLIFDPLAHMANLQKIDRSRTLLAIASGIGAGVLGLRGLEGFIFFVICQLVTGLAFAFVSMGGKISEFIGGGTWWMILSQDFQKSGLSYMLWWTFFYGLCYLF